MNACTRSQIPPIPYREMLLGFPPNIKPPSEHSHSLLLRLLGMMTLKQQMNALPEEYKAASWRIRANPPDLGFEACGANTTQVAKQTKKTKKRLGIKSFCIINTI